MVIHEYEPHELIKFLLNTRKTILLKNYFLRRGKIDSKPVWYISNVLKRHISFKLLHNSCILIFVP